MRSLSITVLASAIFSAASAKTFGSIPGVYLSTGSADSNVVDRYPGTLTRAACQAKCDADPKCITASFYVNSTGVGGSASCSTYSGAPEAVLFPPTGPNGCTSFCQAEVILVTDPARRFLAQKNTRFISNNPIARFTKTDLRTLGMQDCSYLCRVFPKCVVSTSRIDGSCTVMGSDAHSDPNAPKPPIDSFSYVDAEWQDSLINSTSTTSAVTPTGTATTSIVPTQTVPVTTSTVSPTPTGTGTNTNPGPTGTGTGTNPGPTGTSTPPIVNGGHMTEATFTGFNLGISALIVALSFL